MIGRASVKWWCLSFFKSWNHIIVNSVGQHIGVINQSMINGSINHVLQFATIGIKSNLPRHRQILLLDDFPAPVHTKDFRQSCLYSSITLSMACFCSSLRLASVTAMTLSASCSVVAMLILLIDWSH